MNTQNIRRMARDIYDMELSDELLALAVKHTEKLIGGCEIETEDGTDFRVDEYIAALVAVRQAVTLDSSVSPDEIKAGELTVSKRDSAFVTMLNALIREELVYLGAADPEFVFDNIGGDDD